jgi:hypothetical protein
MACKQETEDRGTSALRLPESTRYVDIRDAYRHALWHRRPAAILAVFFASTIVLQGTVAFYRLFTGAQSRADLIIFGSGLFAGLALYTIVTDIAALAESSAAKSRRASFLYRSWACKYTVTSIPATWTGLVSSRSASPWAQLAPQTPDLDRELSESVATTSAH